MTTIQHIILAVTKSECRTLFDKSEYTDHEWNFMKAYMNALREKNLSIQRMETGGVILLWDSAIEGKFTIACKMTKTGIEFSRPHIYDRKALVIQMPLELKFRKPNPRYKPLIDEIRDIKELLKDCIPEAEKCFE